MLPMSFVRISRHSAPEAQVISLVAGFDTELKHRAGDKFKTSARLVRWGIVPCASAVCTALCRRLQIAKSAA